jgi:hypothetical protein
MIGKSTLVSVGVDFTLDGRTFRRLFHFLFLFLCLLLLISTLYHPVLNLQAKNPKNIVKRFWQNFLQFSLWLAQNLLRAIIMPNFFGTVFALPLDVKCWYISTYGKFGPENSS